MLKSFKHVLTKTVFYDPASRAYYKKRDATTAAMLHKGVDAGFVGDHFENDDKVLVVDLDKLPTLPLDQRVTTSVGCLTFSGTVADALIFLETQTGLSATSSECTDKTELVQLCEKLRQDLIDFDVSLAATSEQTS